MFDLCPRRVVGFSTGGLLAPRGWTADAAAHYIVHSSTAAAAAAANTEGQDATRGIESLPLGSSSNTARFECLAGEEEGSTLYVTELFVPRGSTSAPSSSAATPTAGSAERLRSSLLHSSPVASGAPMWLHDSAGGAQVWVGEIDGESDADRHNEDTAVHRGVGPATSLSSALHPFYRVFVEVVWSLSHGDAGEAPAEATQSIVADLRRRYHTPALELDTFACFSLHTAATDAPVASSITATTTGANTTGGAPAAQQTLREPCAAAILADTQPFGINPLFSTCLFSSVGNAFLQLLQTPKTQPKGDTTLHLAAAGARWGVAVESNSRGEPCSAEGTKAPNDQDALPPSLSALAVALSGLLRDRLRLHWEGLSVSVKPSSCAGAVTDSSETCADDVVVAAASLDLGALATPTSLYSFSSVEQAWEAHVTASLQQEKLSTAGPSVGVSGGGVAQRRWTMRKLATTPFPRLEELRAAVNEVEAAQLRMEDPCITTAERAMRCIESQSAPSPLVPRCSTYLLQLVVVDARDAPHLGESSGAGEAEEMYVLRLHAPRVQSRHALVVCMPVPLASGEADASAAEWAAALSSCYRLAPYAPSLWLPRSVGHVVTSGLCCRSGRLLLHVPAGVPAYAGVRCAPVASRSFASLGSIAAWVRRDALEAGAPPLVSPSGCVFTQVGAVWTLVGDGRSAATYLEDALMEHMYDTGSKNLNNIHQPSQHTRQPGVLVVRRRQKQRVRAASAGGRGSAAALIGSYEVCVAWVDVGASHRLLLRVQDVGVGEVLVTEASLVGAHTEESGVSQSGKEAAVAEASRGSRAEEAALEQWVEGIAASAMQKDFR